MRLRDMEELISNNIKYLHVKHSEIKAGNTMEVYDFQKTINAIDSMKSLHFIEKDMSALKQLKALYLNRSESPNILLSLDTKAKYQAIIDSIRMKCDAVLEAINQAISKQNENSISFKLPNSYHSLDKVTDFFQELELSLKLGLNEDDFKVQAFDSGSLWVELLFNNPETLKLLGSIIDAATFIAGLILKSKETKKTLDGLDEATLSSITKHLEQTIHEGIKAQVQEIYKNNENLSTVPEEQGKLEKSVNAMAELLSEGATVTPALNAPQEIKEAFPDEDEFKEIQTRLILISPESQKKITSDSNTEVEDINNN